MAKALNPKFYPVILAGGRGTRFWPLSRKRLAKQLLPLNTDKPMIQETVDRLLPIADPSQFWVITNGDLQNSIVRQLRKVPSKQIIAEPLGRNTAPAIGLAAFILLHRDPDAILGLFPSDHVIGNETRFLREIQSAIQLAAKGENIVVLGMKPTRAETGYGYIEAGEKVSSRLLRVHRFTEKPNAERAAEFVSAGNYFWNSGMFVWGASTLAAALREHLPETAPYLEEIAADYGTRRFEKTFAKLYPKCENISVDFAILEPRSAKGEHHSNLYCIPAEFGWNDLGSWSALWEHRAGTEGQKAAANVLKGKGNFVLDSLGNYVHAPGKFIATVGVNDLVVVETDDALLITTRDRAQDVGKIVKYLDEKKLKALV